MRKIRKVDYVAYVYGYANVYSAYHEGGFACVILHDGKIAHSFSKGLLGTNSYRAELRAILYAAKWMPSGTSAMMHTACDYCINMLRNIIRPLSPDTKNMELINAYRKEASSREVVFSKVRGKCKDPYNLMVHGMVKARIQEVINAYGINEQECEKIHKVMRLGF